MESATKLLRAAITSSVEEKILMLLFDSLSRDTFISGRNRSASLRTQICFANKSPLPPTRKVEVNGKEQPNNLHSIIL